MSTFKKALFSVLALIMCVSLSGCVSLYYAPYDYAFENASKYSVGSGTVSADSIKEIRIGWVSGDVNITSVPGNSIAFRESSRSAIRERYKMCYLLENGILTIHFTRPVNVRGLAATRYSPPDKTLDVAVGEDLLSDLDLLSVDSVSGSVDISGMSSLDLSVRVVSADVTVSDSDFGGVSVDAVSARGDISCFADTIYVNCVSGDFTLRLSSCPRSMYLTSISSNFKIYIPDNDGFISQFNSLAGRARYSFACAWAGNKAIYKGGGASRFTFNSISGNVTIGPLSSPDPPPAIID